MRWTSSATRNTKAAKRFLGKALRGRKEWELPEVANTDKAPAYAVAIAELEAEEKCPKDTRHRQAKYLDHIVEADHGKLKQLIRPVRGQRRELSRALQHLERRQAPGELRRPAGIDEPELRADFAPQRGAAFAPTLCHNVTEMHLALGRTQCPENLAREPHAVNYTRAGFLCSASLVGTGQR